MLAAQHRVTSIAFPSISTGAYGYPKAQAATIAVAAVQDALTRSTSVQLVRFVCFSPDDLEIYRRLLAGL
jgi:O-acetyl-ADP-ribose deacetylase (regulator of RNase III)